MTREAFLARFGGVYERSPWVAEGVLAAGLGPDHDNAEGLPAAMARVVEGARREGHMALRGVGLGPAHDRAEGLQAGMARVVEAAGRERQLALLRAHPDLAGRLAVAGALTASSTAEQASAG